MKKKLAALAMAAVLAVTLTGCFEHDSDVASKNLSTAADQFHIARRIVFYNGITGEYMLTIEGLCALGNDDAPGELTVTCKTGEDQYIKDFLGLSDNVTYFVEQTSPGEVSTSQYKVVFKPSTLVPDFSSSTG